MIHKLSYVDFLALPCERRKGCSIAYVWHKKGEKWVAFFEWLGRAPISPTTFLDFYNLDTENTDTCLKFMAEYHITYIGKEHFDEETGAFYFTVEELRRYHREYKHDFDWVIDEQAYLDAVSRQEKKIEEAGGTEGESESDFESDPYGTFSRVNDQLEKCHPTWRQTRGEMDWANYHYKDFIALCYLQLTLADKTQIIICPECNHKFVADPKQLGRPRKYCSDSCAKAHKKKNDTRYMRETYRPKKKRQREQALASVSKK